MNFGVGETPDVSIVIPTFNRRSSLERLLCGLEAQTGASTFEVIVIVDGATDGTVEMLLEQRPSYPMRTIVQANSGPAAARNRGIEVARGEVIIFLDDDVQPMANLVEQHLRLHTEDLAAVGLGSILTPPGRQLSPWARYEAGILERHYAAMRTGCVSPEARFFFTGNASVRRAHALAVGGFDESFRRGEDVEFGYRLAERGLRYAYVAEAIVHHESDHPYNTWVRIPYQYGEKDVAMATDHDRWAALKQAVESWPRRHPFTRAVAHWAVGRSWRLQLLHSMFEWGINRSGSLMPWRLKLALCSTLFNVRYWEGVADATGCGARVWEAEILSDPQHLSMPIPSISICP